MNTEKYLTKKLNAAKLKIARIKANRNRNRRRKALIAQGKTPPKTKRERLEEKIHAQQVRIDSCIGETKVSRQRIKQLAYSIYKQEKNLEKLEKQEMKSA